MAFKQSFSAPDPLKSLLPCGEGLYDSYQKLLFICSLMDVKDESDSSKFVNSYVSIVWPRILKDIGATGQSSGLTGPCGNCKRWCLPCKAHCWTRCKVCWDSAHFHNINCIFPVGGGIATEIIELIGISKKTTDIISRNRYELGKSNGLAMQRTFKSLNIPKDQGIPLIETTIFSFAKGALEHKEKEGLDILTFTLDNFFASFDTNSMKFTDIISIESCTSAPWFAGYCEAIANVKVEYVFPKKPGEPFSVILKQK